MRSVGTPLLDHVGPMPFPVLQSLFDPLLPPGLQWYWRADFVNEFTGEAIAKHVEQALQTPPGLSQVHIYPIDGAAHRVGKSDTAFSYRDANFAAVIVGIDPDPANKDQITKWCKGYFDALHPYSAGGAYVNFMMEEGQERVESSFRENYPRLAQIKGKYDPGERVLREPEHSTAGGVRRLCRSTTGRARGGKATNHKDTKNTKRIPREKTLCDFVLFVVQILST